MLEFGDVKGMQLFEPFHNQSTYDRYDGGIQASHASAQLSVVLVFVAIGLCVVKL